MQHCVMCPRGPNTDPVQNRPMRLLFISLVSAGIVVFALWLAAVPARAFSLMGPYGNWAAPTNSYRMGWDVGGPVDINEGYRWNVPVVTYGFDQSFLMCFGTEGVSAVEQAIQIFNDLRAASAMVLTNSGMNTRWPNYTANAQNLLDLRSAAMAILIEQLGLAEPERSVFVLHRWDPSVSSLDEAAWPQGSIPEFIWRRNFDPESLSATHWINRSVFTGIVIAYYGNPMSYVIPYLIDPEGNDLNALADWRRNLRPFGDFFNDGVLHAVGMFCTGITYDDAGGLRYLLSRTNVQLEALLPGVRGIGPNAQSFVNLAFRPGIDRIKFVRHPVDDAGRPRKFRSVYTDTYITNGVAVRQHLERVLTQPDILFSAADLGATNTLLVPLVRSGTENWWNSASVTGSGAVGPGVIRPPVSITFNALSPFVETTEDPIPGLYPIHYDFRWGSFNFPTNPVVPLSSVLPNTDTNQMSVRLWLLRWDDSSVAASYTWHAPVRVGQGALFQMSTNTVNWESQVITTNRGGTVIWRHFFYRPQRFFRVVPL